MSIQDFTEVLLNNTERTATWLSLADKFIQQYNEDSKHFILPRAYAFMLPAIEAYAGDIDGFLVYLLGVRDSLPKNSDAFKQVQALYRKVSGRWTQKQRRDRAARAVAKAEELYGEIPYQQRLQWIANLEHAWAGRRLAFLDEHRAGGRLSVDVRADLLREFWAIIDTEIENGGVPRWE